MTKAKQTQASAEDKKAIIVEKYMFFLEKVKKMLTSGPNYSGILNTTYCAKNGVDPYTLKALIELKVVKLSHSAGSNNYYVWKYGDDLIQQELVEQVRKKTLEISNARKRESGNGGRVNVLVQQLAQDKNLMKQVQPSKVKPEDIEPTPEPVKEELKSDIPGVLFSPDHLKFLQNIEIGSDVMLDNAMRIHDVDRINVVVGESGYVTLVLERKRTELAVFKYTPVMSVTLTGSIRIWRDKDLPLHGETTDILNIRFNTNA